MPNTVNETAIKKLKLLFTIVDRPKAEFYLDVLSQFEVNLQMVNFQPLHLWMQEVLRQLLKTVVR